MKKLWSIVLLATIGLNLVACGSGNSTDNNTSTGTDSNAASSREKKKITVWAWDPAFNIAVMEEAKERYIAAHPDIEIEIMDFAKTDVEQKLHTNLASGSTKGLPEIVLIEDYNAQKYLRSYPNAFYDLTGKINHNDFAEYKVDVMTVDDKIYGVPFDTGVNGFYYRTDVLSEAGYTEEDLNNITWYDYIEIGKAIKEKTGKYMLTLDPSDGGIIRTMLQSSGSWYFDKEGNPSIKDNEALKEIVGIYQEMMQSGIAKPISGWSEFVGAFNSGDVASVVTGAWITPSVMAEESQKGLWKIAPTPKLTVEGSVNATNLGGSSWYILNDAPNKDIAVDFMNTTFGNDVDFYQTILKEIGCISTYLPALTGEAYNQPNEFFGGQTIYADFAKWIEEIPPVNYGVYTWEADSILMAEIMNVLNGTAIDTALENAERQVMQQVQ